MQASDNVGPSVANEGIVELPYFFMAYLLNKVVKILVVYLPTQTIIVIIDYLTVEPAEKAGYGRNMEIRHAGVFALRWPLVIRAIGVSGVAISVEHGLGEFDRPRETGRNRHAGSKQEGDVHCDEPYDQFGLSDQALHCIISAQEN